MKKNLNCTCKCHNDEDIKHTKSCCMKCPYCFERIIFGQMGKHIVQDHPEIIECKYGKND